jgi:hypothetical protein
MDSRPTTHILAFEQRFARPVRCGEKRRMIRREATSPIAFGDRLILEEQLPDGSSVPIGEARCCAVHRLSITEAGQVRFDGVRLCPSMATQFAKSDGFSTAFEMQRFIRERYGLPFDGVVICW